MIAAQGALDSRLTFVFVVSSLQRIGIDVDNPGRLDGILLDASNTNLTPYSLQAKDSIPKGTLSARGPKKIRHSSVASDERIFHTPVEALRPPVSEARGGRRPRPVLGFAPHLGALRSNFGPEISCRGLKKRAMPFLRGSHAHSKPDLRPEP